MSHACRTEDSPSIRDVLAQPHLQPGTPEHYEFWRRKPALASAKTTAEVSAATLAAAAHTASSPEAQEAPTWLNPIRSFFTKEDIECMRKSVRRLDLAIYEDVKESSHAIFGQVASGAMPKKGQQWDRRSKVDVFFEWSEAGCPFGEGKPEHIDKLVQPQVARLRKNITELLPADVEKLKTAFRGMMARDPKHEESYFALAAIHGLPGKPKCNHHSFLFFPWHRIYNLKFENAMRSVQGCEDITLPYWDQASTEPIPEWVWEEPFDSFTYPMDVGTKKAGTKTQRAGRDKLHEYLNNDTIRIRQTIYESFLGSSWEQFGVWKQRRPYGAKVSLETAHDTCHDHVGKLDTDGENEFTGDMTSTSYAAFDPLFWFQHADYDRLVWEWQMQHGATTEIGFTQICREKKWVKLYLTGDQQPWHTGDNPENFAKHLDLHNFKISEKEVGIGYTAGSCSEAHPPPAAAVAAAAQHLPIRTGALPYELVARPQQKVLWVKNVNRTKIIGSFRVLAYAQEDGQAAKTLIGTEHVLQFSEPGLCENCEENPLATFAFRVPHEFSNNAEYSVEIWRNDGTPVFLQSCGSPTLEVAFTLRQ